MAVRDEVVAAEEERARREEQRARREEEREARAHLLDDARERTTAQVQARRREWQAEWAGEAPAASDREVKQELAGGYYNDKT